MPLRLPRLAQAVAVIGLASAPLVGFVMPGHADTWLQSRFHGQTASQALRAMTQSTMYWRPDRLSNGAGHGAVIAAKALTEATTVSPPGARPAGHGALPRLRPATPRVPSNIAVILRDLVGDVFISAAVLACLLVPIMWYGSIIKRRDRMVALAAADRAQHSMLGWSGRRGTGEDPLLDFFGPQEAPAGIPAGPQRSGPRFQPRPALSGRSTLTPAFAPRPMLAAPHVDVDHADSFAEAPGRGHSDAWGDAGAWGTQSRGRDADHDDRQRGQDQGHSSTLRHAPVAGTPPWEPAPQPTGELPWAVLSRPGQGSGSHPGFGSRAKQAPDESPWATGSETQSAPPSSLFDADPRQDLSDGADTSEGRARGPGQGPGPDRRSDSDWSSFASRRSSGGERPIYIWDPESAEDDDLRLSSRGER